MRIIEKKCPNCNAPLSIEDGKTDITCEYCHSKLRLVKDPIEQGFELVSRASKRIMFFQLFIALTVIIIFAIIFIVLITKFDHPFEHASDKKTTSTTTDSFDEEFNKRKDEIDKIYDKIINDVSTSNKVLSDNLPKGSTISELSSVGAYFLNSKKGNEMRIYTISKRTLNNNGTKKDFYIAELHSNLDINNIDESIDSKVYSSRYYLDSTNTYYVDGYESLKELYDKHIKPLSKEYSISVNGNIYDGN